MEWKKDIDKKLQDALKEKDLTRINALRLLKTSLVNEELKSENGLTEEKFIEVVQREIKKRKEAIEAFKNAGQIERALDEENELKVLSEFLPKQLSENEIETIVDNAIKEVGAETLKDIGKVMAKVMPQIKGKADGKLVNQIVQKKLSR